jgi:diguanylate cyclase (GGDEF)-like protein
VPYDARHSGSPQHETVCNACLDTCREFLAASGAGETKDFNVPVKATMDALTGLNNRGAFDRTVKGLAEMPGAQFSLALIDIDNLKKVNDMHGHLAGDRVLSGLAHALKSAVRDEDLVARHGGDEFAVLMRDAPLRQAESRIWNAVSAFTNSRLTADDGQNGLLSAVCG